MREVSGFGYIGCCFLAMVICSLVGCVMPSRDSLKEPGWNPTTGRGPTVVRKPDGTSLIKPFIPPESTAAVTQSPPGATSGILEHLPVAAPEAPMPQGAARPDIAANVSSQPMPRPVRWHDPSLDQAGHVRPLGEPSSLQSPTERDLPIHEMQQGTDISDDSLAAAEASPGLPSAPPMQPSPPMQAPPAAIQPTPPPSPRAQAETGQRYASETSRSAPTSTVKPLPPAQTPSTSANVPGALEAKAGSRQWEDQRVKQAASKLAEKFPAVKKGKICYSVKNDEWWVVLYEDAGALYDLKQYTWNRDQEKLEQFLVLKRIGKNRLEEELGTREPDRACEPIDFP